MKIYKLLRPFTRSNARCLHVCRVDWFRAWPKPEYGPMEVQRSVLLNGSKVAAAKHLGSEMSAVTVMFQAGSRYECDDELGASHFLRSMSNATGCAYSGYAKVRYLQQHGAAITCTNDRQTISYTLRCPFPLFSELKPYLIDTACRCQILQWELDDQKRFMWEELYQMHPEQRVMDMIQEASFSGPLSNSMFCTEERLDAMEDCSVNCFAAANFLPNVMSIGSVGVPFEEVMKLAEILERSTEQPPPRMVFPSCHRSTTLEYDLGVGSDTWVALSLPGCGTKDVSTLLKHAVVANACGVGDMQTGQHHHDRTPMAPLGTMAGEDIYTKYSAFNISYADLGIFGILVKTKAKTAWNAVTAAAQFLGNVADLDFKQIDAGKKRLQLRMALHEEDCVRVSEGLALQCAGDVKVDSHRDWIALLDSLSPEEICGTARELTAKNCCMSMAVVGDISAVPNEKELKCGK